MKRTCTFLFVAAVCLAFTVVRAQAPLPLDSADFPHHLDSIFIKTSKIPPTESFSDSISANDSLSIDRCLQKAIIALSDTYMANIQNGGANLNWTVVTFYYTALPNPNNWKKIWYDPSPFVPGASSFPTANLYYQGTSSGFTTYNFYHKSNTGFYELGSRVMESTPYNIINIPEKPVVQFPVDYSIPGNALNQNTTSTAYSSVTATTSSHYDVTVDAYGTLTLVTGTISSPIYTDYEDCIRTQTHSIDTMDLAGTGMMFYLETKIYNWYAPGIFEPIVTYSVSQVRNNVDPMFWSLDPALAWHDEIEMSFVVPYTTASIDEANPNAQVSVIPNPSKGPISLFIGGSGPCVIEIFDILGNRLHEEQTRETKIDLDLGSFKKGVYFLRVTYPTGKVTAKKIVIN